jgi:phosphocarrier protein HPr
MYERTVTVASRSGLHARPAAMFVKAAAAQPVRVKVRVGDGPAADARSILAVLALRVGHGTAVTLSAPDDGESEGGGEGTAAKEAVDALAELLARDLDAEPTPTPTTQVPGTQRET